MKQFVGFGFGPIQSGLFLLEAWRSGNFSRFTVAEIDAQLVAAVNGNGGKYHVNIAHADRIERIEVKGVQLLNPRVEKDRERLIDAVRDADELATALPRVDFYDGNPAAAVPIVAAALKSGSTKPQVLYAAENNNDAAEIFVERLASHLPPGALDRFQAVDTVLGKMSGVITEPAVIERLNLTPMVPGSDRAILVESFNRILIGHITLDGFKRGITVFEEKEELTPFEEAKLYGHNAVHALLGYLAHERGLSTMAELRNHADLLAIGRGAFVDESGAALCREYAHLHDPLFTPAGFAAYADDLLARMTNPLLYDLVERVIRDPQRKLGWRDRIYGAMRLALAYDVIPRQMALGAAAAVRYLAAPHATREQLQQTLLSIWGDHADAAAPTLIDLTWAALQEKHDE